MRLRKKHQFPDKFAFISISAFLILFYTAITYEATPLVKVVLFVSAFFFAEGLYFLKSSFLYLRWEIEKEAEAFAAVTIASVVTFLININGLGPVIASASVGIVYSMIAGRLGNPWSSLSAPVYCGSFVGMCFEMVFSEVWMVALAGMVAGAMYVVAEEVFVGVGGKLGTIAFVGSVTIRTMMDILGV